MQRLSTCKNQGMSTYEQQLHDLDGREAFALAQGREDLVDEIDRERRELQAAHDDEDAAAASSSWAAWRELQAAHDDEDAAAAGQR